MNTKPGRHRALIIGAGTAGIAVAAQLRRREPKLDLAIVEPSPVHYCKAMWASVGGGVYVGETSRRELREVLPQGVAWIQNAAVSIDADTQTVALDTGAVIGYDVLVVCTGSEPDWNSVPGLVESIGQNGVCSVYDYDYARYTWETLKVLESGQALFTMPDTPVRCFGSQYEIMFLTADNLRQRGRLDRTGVSFFTPDTLGQSSSGVWVSLQKICDRYGIETNRGHKLVSVDGPARTAKFEVAGPAGPSSVVERSFDMLHVVPQQGASRLISTSGLADPEGWLDVYSDSLRHERYPNVFGAGDVVGATRMKTTLGISRQASVVAPNALRALEGDHASVSPDYDGYQAAVISTGYGRALRLETEGYHADGASVEISGSGRRLLTHWLHKRSFPRKYWNDLLKGRL